MIKNNKINWKNVLILILVFILGFGTGMVITFQGVFNLYEKYNILK